MANDKFGREPVRAISDPHSGAILTGRVTATSDNFWGNLNGDGADLVRTPDPEIEGVIVKADVANVAYVRIVEQGRNGVNGYPLAASEAVSIGTDKLSKIRLFIDGNGESATYLAIAKAV